METIVCGDFNEVVNPSIDQSSENKQSTSTNAENELLGWMVDNQVADSFHGLYAEVCAYSYHETSRLDMIWIPGGLKRGLTEAGMMPLGGRCSPRSQSNFCGTRRAGTNNTNPNFIF